VTLLEMLGYEKFRQSTDQVRTLEYSGEMGAWRLIKALAIVVALVALLVAGTMLWALHNLPLEKAIADGLGRPIVVEAANLPLRDIRPFKVENAALKDFPEHLVNAVLSVEDRRFYRHWGIDPYGIARALRRNTGAGTIVQGGSTITQQLVKIRTLASERTYARKLRVSPVSTCRTV